MSSTPVLTGAKNNGSRLSKDGNWRSFPKVPNLLQYVRSKTYYARVKQNGKIIRRSLETTVFTTAKLKLPDFIKTQQQEKPDRNVRIPTVAEALTAYKLKLNSITSLKESSREYRMTCIRKIELSWPELWTRKLNDISETACQSWAANLHKQIAAQYFNNTIATLRSIFDAGISLVVGLDTPLKNPALNLNRTRVVQTELKLPEPSQFKEIVESIAKESGGWGPKAADLVEFLAYSGLRLYTEAIWVNWEDIDWKKKEIIVRGNPITHTKNWEIRRVPLIPDMESLLKRMRTERPTTTGRILQISRCPESLKRACAKVGIPRLSHHDLRHLFATRCIESGVDIPTVARWLGHKDGGALAMKTYGHLRNEHSQAMDSS